MIQWSLDAQTISHSIQLAVAPVFLLTAVAGMLGVVAGRLARIIDRGRKLEDLMRGSDDEQFLARYITELHFLARRGRIANGCIALLTLCGVCIGVTIVFLFLGEAYEFSGHRYAILSFMLGIFAFLGALLCFLWETILATRVMKFHTLTQMRAAVRHVRESHGQQPPDEAGAPSNQKRP